MNWTRNIPSQGIICIRAKNFRLSAHLRQALFDLRWVEFPKHLSYWLIPLNLCTEQEIFLHEGLFASAQFKLPLVCPSETSTFCLILDELNSKSTCPMGRIEFTGGFFPWILDCPSVSSVCFLLLKPQKLPKKIRSVVKITLKTWHIHTVNCIANRFLINLVFLLT